MPNATRCSSEISVSVVIPTLNEAQRIGGLLEAIKRQNFAGNLEIIVADGQSEDETAAIACQFEGVQVLQTARGVSRQRNAGAAAATGELLVFFDADDLPGPDFLAQIAASYQKFPFAVACPWLVARDAGLGVRLIYFGFNLGFWLGQSTLRMGSGVCLICPREKFLLSSGFDENLHLGEDIRLIRALCPKFGLHRHLWVPLETSGRRFGKQGAARLMLFYLLITPFLVLGLWKPLQKFKYRPV